MKSGMSYADLGSDVFDRLEPERLTRYSRLVKKLVPGAPLSKKSLLSARR